jgi:hypothetical protein
MATQDEIDNQLWKLREELLPRVKTDGLKWHEVDLGFRAKVKVCSPASVRVTYNDVKHHKLLFEKPPFDDPERGFRLFVPVTKLDTWKLAQYFEAYPLTKAVSDRAHNRADTKRDKKAPEYSAGIRKYCYDFVGYSLTWLNKVGYRHSHNAHLASGAHKLWIMSNTVSARSPDCPGAPPGQDPSVNYGFYDSDKATGVWQSPASCHNQDHWDYSQLLQLMTDFRVNDRPVSMTRALLTGHPAVWDVERPRSRVPNDQEAVDSKYLGHTDTGVCYKPKTIDQQYLGFSGLDITSHSHSAPNWLNGWWKVTYWNNTKTEYYLFSNVTNVWKQVVRNQVMWTYAAPKKATSVMSKSEGNGFWVIRGSNLIISWKNSGSWETWSINPAQLSSTSPIPITVNTHTGYATKVF